MSSTDTTKQETSQQIVERNAEEAHVIFSQIRAAIRDGRDAAWRVAEGFYEFDNISGWKHLDFDTVGHFLADPEIGFSKATYYRYIAAYKKIAVDRKVERERYEVLDVSKVQIVLPALEAGKVTIDEAISDVEMMGQRDLRATYVPAEPKADSEPEPAEGQKVSSDETSGPKPSRVVDLDEPAEPITGEVVDAPESRTAWGNELADDVWRP